MRKATVRIVASLARIFILEFVCVCLDKYAKVGIIHEINDLILAC